MLKLISSPSRTAVAAAACALSLSGCGMLSSLTEGDKVDYRSAARKTQPLEVPPDLTQLSRDGRYAPQAGGTVSASALQQQQTTGTAGGATATNAALVAPNRLGDMRIDRRGDDRWLVTPVPPEQLWPKLRSFWLDRGFTLVVDSPEAGVMETEWAENRAKLPDDFIRNTLGRVLNSLYSTGERDKFRVRVERVGASTEVSIAHIGLEEVLVGTRGESTMWTSRPTDTGLEGEMLTRLMVQLGASQEQANAQLAAAAAAPGSTAGSATSKTPAPPRARAVADGTAALEVDDNFDRAWRRVGLALDRGGFTVEDRDRASGVFFVRYVDPKSTAAGEPNFIMKWFSGGDAAREPVRYRIQLVSTADKTRATVLSSSGAADNSESARNIASLLVEELK